MSDNTNNQSQKQSMPSDFWQMVRQAQDRARKEVEEKRQRIYRSFMTEEIKSGQRIPMPKGFWQAIDQQPQVSEVASPSLESEPVASLSLSSGVLQPMLPLEAAIEILPAETPALETTITPLTHPTDDPLYLIESDNYEDEASEHRLSFKEAALVILKRERRAMTAKDIVNMAVKEGLLATLGKTPDASLAGQIYNDIHRNREMSPFEIVGPRTYSLKEFNPPTLKETTLKEVAPPLEVKPTPSPYRKVVAGNFPVQPSSKNELKPADPPPDNRKLSYKQAALYLLEREQHPMTAKEIVTVAIEEGLIESTGKTPDATLAGQLYTMQREGERSAIKLVAPRTYALTEWYKK